MTPPPEDDAAGAIAALVKAHAGAGLPVRLRMWDGSEAGPQNRPVLVVRSEQNQPAIAAILTEEQVRVWRLYLAGSALAFEDGRMGVDQILAVKPGPLRPGPVPPQPVRPAP
jgi:hypothetical protein